MSKPFTLAFVEGVTAAPRKPGWHKRGLAAERAAASRRTSVAPQHGDSRANAKAVEYARWLAARDSIALPRDLAPSVGWEGCRAGMRPRCVIFGDGASAVTIALPHWSYEAPEPVAVELLSWAAPVVTERPAAPVLAPLDAADVAEALALAYLEPVETELFGTFEAGTLIFAATIVSPDLNAPPVEAIRALAPVEAIAAESDTKTGTNYSDPIPEPDAGAWRPSVDTHPIVALCLSPAAAEALFERVLDGTFRAAGRTAKGGAWRLTLEDARACADIPSLRLVGMPRKPYPRRAAPPVEAIPVVEIRTGLAAMPPAAIAGATPRPIVYHSPA